MCGWVVGILLKRDLERTLGTKVQEVWPRTHCTRMNKEQTKLYFYSSVLFFSQ